jgi:magnesium transporter
MTNTLYLPELREYLAQNDTNELREFCDALHPARAAEFMEGLTPQESWEVLHHASEEARAEIFRFFDPAVQIEVISTNPRKEVAALIANLRPDERVDLLKEIEPRVCDELLELVPADDRLDILRLRAYPEGTAGAVMTTDFARLREDMTVAEATQEVRRQAKQQETIFYLYVVDAHDYLRGLISLRDLVLGDEEARIGDLMERDVVVVHVADDQEEVAQTMARYDFLAIPVVNQANQILGIATYDDIIDVVVEEATEDAHRIAAIDPLNTGYLQTQLFTLTWKRGMWLMILFLGSLITAYTLSSYEGTFARVPWLVLFIPLVISSGGNSGSQSATLIITALSTGDITLSDWARIVWREFLMGILLGGFLAMMGYIAAAFHGDVSFMDATVVPLTLLLVVLCGTLSGSLLPLLFCRLGLDPAMMSNPFVACIIDIVGILIYMGVALTILEVPLAGH